MSPELISILGPAFVAGLMISVTHAPLGIEVLKRGIIFIDLAVAQVAGLGFVASGVFFLDPSPWFSQLVALACALLAVLFFRWIDKAMPRQQEAIIGVSFVLAASLAMLLLADHPGGSDRIRHLLSGEMLFTTWTDITTHAPVYALILVAWFGHKSLRTGTGFYLLFAIAITSSVQIVGVYVVFASLILPALAALNARKKYLVAWSCGVLSLIAGISLAAAFDAPVGPVIVLSYVLTSVLVSTILLIRTVT